MNKIPLLTSVMTPFPYSVDLEASFDEASELMGHHNVHHLPVTRDNEVVGVITDKDLTSATGVHPPTGGSVALSVRDLYRADPYIVSVDEPLDDVLLTMAERHIDSAIVTKAGKLVGMFTATDACRTFGEYLRGRFPHADDGGVA
jgi:acetoin utilization protein AcuB